MPPVTPRSFRRFFGPRRPGPQSTGNDGGRLALADIDASSLNQRCSAASEKSSPQNLPRKRRAPPDALLDNATTPKRQKRCDEGIIRSSPKSAECPPDANAARIKPSKIRCAFGDVLHRELGFGPKIGSASGSVPWRSQTAGFLSEPDDVHRCTSVGNGSTWTLPFCTAACRTNSLVAVGDEEGGIRLVETMRHSKPAFSNTVLAFRPHANATVDLSFSSDDMLLATASGDQTASVIDMPSQQVRCKLVGHHSTVKQVRFQPGSGDNVIATSSRDGSIRIWDLRCKGTVGTAIGAEVGLDALHEQPVTGSPQQLPPLHGACVNMMSDAHHQPPSSARGQAGDSDPCFKPGTSRRVAASAARAEVSVTALSFVSASRASFLISGSQACAGIKLWDLRMNHAPRSKRATPLSVTRQPEAHDRHRQFGLTALAMSGDASRFYALCRDNTAYVYSTEHLVLGSCPEWDAPAARARRGSAKTGLGPLYGLRHPKLKVSSFYVKLDVRPASAGRGELLAVGSNSSCPIIFPTEACSPVHAGQAGDPEGARVKTLSGLPTCRNGLALAGGHEKEVTDVAWTSEGDVVSIGDDFRCRLWREGSEDARDRRRTADAGQQLNVGQVELGEDDSWDESE